MEPITATCLAGSVVILLTFVIIVLFLGQFAVKEKRINESGIYQVVALVLVFASITLLIILTIIAAVHIEPTYFPK